MKTCSKRDDVDFKIQKIIQGIRINLVEKQHSKFRFQYTKVIDKNTPLRNSIRKWYANFKYNGDYQKRHLSFFPSPPEFLDVYFSNLHVHFGQLKNEEVTTARWMTRKANKLVSAAVVPKFIFPIVVLVCLHHSIIYLHKHFFIPSFAFINVFYSLPV